MKSLDYNEFLGLSGLHPGSIIDVSSGLSSVKHFAEANQLSFDADSLIDELKKMVGNEGTLLIRTFSWTFCKGIAFNPRETPSQTGALGNVAIRRMDFQRTQHPLYSWMVWGKYQDELCNYDCVDGFDQNGVFGFLERNHAKQLLVGKQKIAGLTIGHYVEAKVGVPYRQYKFFEADYCDKDGGVSRRRYSMYVRPLNIGVENIFGKEQVQGIMADLGIRKNFNYKDSLPLAMIDIAQAAKFVSDDIQNNDGKHTMKVDGVCGINACGVDWTTAKYY